MGDWKMKYCIKCGAELKQGASFCIKCGNKIEGGNGAAGEAKKHSEKEPFKSCVH